jgi:hypothetical protein
MKNLSTCIALTSGTVLVYVVATTLPIGFSLLFWLMLLSQTLLIWMVIRILKDKAPQSGKTFDSHFYEDADLKS